MGRTTAYVLFLLSSALAKYVPVTYHFYWPGAQTYCRLYYTDLAVISNAHDNDEALQIATKLGGIVWIGLRWNDAQGAWMWSGGGAASTFFWATSQPEYNGQIYGLLYHGRWHDAGPSWSKPSICIHVIVVKQRKTWLEAMQHCRQHHSDLVSVASETELLLMQTEMEKNAVDEAVWIGLYFFPEGWLWVDGRPLEYEAWLQDERPVCPRFGSECAALNRTGNDLRAGAVDCEERLYFLCY